jgi:hypothetical protein
MNHEEEPHDLLAPAIGTKKPVIINDAFNYDSRKLLVFSFSINIMTFLISAMSILILQKKLAITISLALTNTQLIVIISEGLAEQRRADEAFRVFSAKLEAVNREREIFCDSVSHDLRAPLRP